LITLPRVEINVRNKPKGQSRMDNPTQRRSQHWVYKAQDEDKQNKKHNTKN
jgi:hypothetical protein